MPTLEEIEGASQIALDTANLWKYLAPLLETRLETYRLTLENPQNTHEEDIKIKASIEEVKYMISLPELFAEQAVRAMQDKKEGASVEGSEEETPVADFLQ